MTETDAEIEKQLERQDREVGRIIAQRMMEQRLPALYAKWRAKGRYPAVLRHEAVHEAAHAVVAEVVGHDVLILTLAIDREPWHPYCRILNPGDWPSEIRRTIVHGLAGQAVEVLSGWKRGDWRRMSRGAADGTSDRSCAILNADKLAWERPRQETLDHLWIATLRLVRRRRSTIERVAGVLLERETLQADELHALIEDDQP
ncbi:MAG: hypothetical protein ABSC46_13025 [Candidatus Limnocylindrales bacterium]|jgi:hypothetical protein